MIKFVMTKARIKRPSYKHMDIYTRADTGGGNRGLSPPPEQFQGGTVPPPENCPPPEQFRGGTAKMSPPE